MGRALYDRKSFIKLDCSKSGAPRAISVARYWHSAGHRSCVLQVAYLDCAGCHVQYRNLVWQQQCLRAEDQRSEQLAQVIPMPTLRDGFHAGVT